MAFTTLASDLGPRDAAGTGFLRSDVYVRNLATGTVTMVSARADGKNAGNDNSFLTAWHPDSTPGAVLQPGDRPRAAGLDSSVDVSLATLQAPT